MVRYDNAWKYRLLAGLYEAGLIKFDIWMDRIKPNRDYIGTEELYALLNTLFPTLEMIMDRGVRVPSGFAADIVHFIEHECREAL